MSDKANWSGCESRLEPFRYYQAHFSKQRFQAAKSSQYHRVSGWVRHSSQQDEIHHPPECWMDDPPAHAGGTDLTTSIEGFSLL